MHQPSHSQSFASIGFRFLRMVCGLIGAGLIFSGTALAQPSGQASFDSLLEFGLGHSLDRQSAKAAVDERMANHEMVQRMQMIPQLNLTAGYQKLYYDTLKMDGLGQPVTNNGQNTSYGLTASYDLQKLFGPEQFVARQSLESAKVARRLADREIIRNIKKAYSSVVEITAEIAELTKLIALFDRIDKVLLRQKSIGIFNELERKQFQVQQSILGNDLETRRADLDAVYLQLSALLNTSLDDTKLKVQAVSQKPPLRIAPETDPETLAALEDADVVANLARDFRLAQIESEKFSAVPLPAVYAKAARELPTYFSSDGSQTAVEVGLSFPLDGLAIRPAQARGLSAKADQLERVYERAIFDYRNQIRLQAFNLRRYRGQAAGLKRSRDETEKLLEKTFLFYSQKRLDVLGTLDIFQKYLQSARNDLNNQLQIENSDAELEFLVGGALK